MCNPPTKVVVFPLINNCPTKITCLPAPLSEFLVQLPETGCRATAADGTEFLNGRHCMQKVCQKRFNVP